MLAALRHFFEWVQTLSIAGVGFKSPRIPGQTRSEIAPSEGASLTSMAAKGKGTPAPPSAKAAEKTLIPGNFLTFPVSIEVHVAGTAHMGYPAMAMRDVTSGTVRWALDSSIFLRESPLHSLTWEDDPERGIGQRTLVSVEDVLGAEGRLQEHSYRFEQVLGLGPKLVVYALFNPSSGSRLAYSFSREAFEPGYVSPQPSEE